MKATPKPHITTTPTFWSDEIALSHDPLAGEAQVTAVTGDNVIVGWSSNGDIFGFQLNVFGSFVTGNLVADLTNAVFTPLSHPQFVQQSDGSLIVEYRETFATQTGPDTDVIWHMVNTADPLNETPLEGSRFNEVLQDVTALAGNGGSAFIYETPGTQVPAEQFLVFTHPDGGEANFVPVGFHAGQSQLNPSIVGLPNGNVAVAYENHTPGAVGTPGEHDIRLHIYTPAGGDVADAGNGSHEVMVGGTGLIASHPDIAVTNGGTPNASNDDQIVVAWQDNNGIEFRRFTNERGLALDQAPHLNAGSGGGLAAHVVGLNDGGFIVEWGQAFGQESDGSNDFDLVLQRFDKNGNAVGDEVFIDNPGDQGPVGVSLATLQDGRVIVTFNNETGDSTNLTTLDYVILDPRNQTINGTTEGDSIVGRQDASVINGLAGNDLLVGMNGNDTLNGGADLDRLIGGLGKDKLIGGGDIDVFDFDSIRDSKVKAPDMILDFHHGEDAIDLSDIDANTKVDDHQDFHFIGAHKFHHKAGELHFVSDHHRGVFVEGDVNGDGRADFRIDVLHVSHLAGGDFILIQT